MSNDILFARIQEACDFEEKFLVDFESFFTTLDKYGLMQEEKDFVETRVRVLFDESKRHLGFFSLLLEKITHENKKTV